MVVKFSPNQTKTLSDYLITIAASWFIAGAITPVFTKLPQVEKVQNFVLGILLSFAYLYIALRLNREDD